MGYIIEFLDFIDALLKYVIGLLAEACYALTDFVVMLFKSLRSMPSVFSIFPDELAYVFVGLFSVVVIYKVLGRE